MRKHNQQGFTLIELVITIGLLGITLGVTNDILISLIRSYSKVQVKNEIEQQANFVSLKLEKELRSASDVSAPAADGSQLAFLSRDGARVTYSVTAAGVLHRLQTISGVTTEEDLTYGGVPAGVAITCTGACFTVTGDDPQIVDISMKFSQANTNAVSSFTGQVNIKSTIVVRNTY